MLRFVSILLAMVAMAVVVGAVRKALHLGPEFLGGGFPEELADLGLLVAGLLIVSLSDRELFWAAPPKRKRPGRRSGTTA
jgi:hypothetical protein